MYAVFWLEPGPCACATSIFCLSVAAGCAPQGGGGGVGGLIHLEHPCPCAERSTLLFDDQEAGLLSCDGAEALWETADGGASWWAARRPPGPSVWSLHSDPGGVLACGGGDGGPLLLKRGAEGRWDLVEGAPEAGQCFHAAPGDGGLTLMALGDGLAWGAHDPWEVDRHGAWGGINRVVDHGGARAAGGWDEDGRPVFMTWREGPDPSPVPVLEDQGPGCPVGLEVLEVLSGPEVLLVGDGCRGGLARSVDGGVTWAPVDLGDDPPVLSSVAFGSSGWRGLAAGRRGDGGALMYTDDAGETWSELLLDPPPLHGVAVHGARFWAVGRGYLVAGLFY